MERKCKYRQDLETKNKKMVAVIILAVICFLLISLLKSNWDKLIFIFYDNSGVFSNEVFWSAIGSIGSVLALIGVIITIKYTEYSRKKQNEYEFQKQHLLEVH